MFISASLGKWSVSPVSLELSLSFLSLPLSQIVHPHPSCRRGTWHPKPPPPGPWFRSPNAASQHFMTCNWHVFLVPLWVSWGLAVPGGAQPCGSASQGRSSPTWLFTAAGGWWGKEAPESDLCVLVLEPRPGAAAFWKGCFMFHCHRVDGRHKRMSWSPLTVARVFLAKADHVADAKI